MSELSLKEELKRRLAEAKYEFEYAQKRLCEIQVLWLAYESENAQKFKKGKAKNGK